MPKMKNQCDQCGNKNAGQLVELFEYTVCQSCKAILGLLKDETIRKHVKRYAKAQEEVPENPSYANEVSYRIDILAENYIKTRIKLLHIQQRLQQMEE